MNQLSISLMWFWIGIGSLGMAIGYFVGLSQSPVIATLLPLLFGLMGGSSGFLVARIKPSEPESTKTLKYFGIAFVVFSIAVIASSFFALDIRHRSGQVASRIELSFSDVEPEMAMKLLTFRKKLEILDASEKEQQQILQFALLEKVTNASTGNEIGQYLENLAVKSKSTAKIIEVALKQGHIQPDKNDKSNLKNLLAILKEVGPIFEHCIASVANNETIPIASISNILNIRSYHLGELLRTGNRTQQMTISRLSHHPELLKNLLELQSACTTNVPRWKATSKSRLPDINNEVDDLIKLLLTKKETNQQQGIDERIKLAYTKPPYNIFDF